MGMYLPNVGWTLANPATAARMPPPPPPLPETCKGCGAPLRLAFGHAFPCSYCERQPA